MQQHVSGAEDFIIMPEKVQQNTIRTSLFPFCLNIFKRLLFSRRRKIFHMWNRFENFIVSKQFFWMKIGVLLLYERTPIVCILANLLTPWKHTTKQKYNIMSNSWWQHQLSEKEGARGKYMYPLRRLTILTLGIWYLTFNQWTNGTMDHWTTGPIDWWNNGPIDDLDDLEDIPKIAQR